MKKTYAIFLLGVIALAPVGTAQAQLVAEYDFSAAQGYVDGPLVGQPAGADYTWQEGAPDLPSDVVFTVANEAMLVTQTPPGAYWIYCEFPTQTEGDLTCTWDWQFLGPEANVNIGVCFSDSVNFNLDDNPALNWPEQGAMTRMQPDTNEIDVRNGDWEGGGTYEAFEGFDYTDGALIHMRMMIHILDLTLDVYAMKDGEAEVTLAEGYGFRRIPSVETDGINCISMWANGDALSSLILDNLVIAGPTSINHWELH